MEPESQLSKSTLSTNLSQKSPSPRSIAREVLSDEELTPRRDNFFSSPMGFREQLGVISALIGFGRWQLTSVFALFVGKMCGDFTFHLYFFN